MNLEFSRHILKNIQISNFMKIRPVEAKMSHVDGQTERQTDRHYEGNSRVWVFGERV